MQRKPILAATLVLALAACGGGGSSSGGSNPLPNPNPSPTSSVNDANIPLIVPVGGSNAFVASNNKDTLYYLTSDTSTGQACTVGCLAIWPPYMAASGATAQGNMTIITRADGTGQQWAFQGHPLYNFSGDNGPEESNGEGISQPPGVWHVSRPAGSSGGGGNGY